MANLSEQYFRLSLDGTHRCVYKPPVEMKYQNVLRQAYEDRVFTNPRYSMRSFARDLGVAPSTLSEVMSGKKGISPKKAAVFARCLRLPDWQVNLFTDLVTQAHAKSSSARIAARKRLKGRKQENHLHLVNHTALRALTSWIDLAVLELTYLKDFRPSATWIAKKIGTEETAVSQSVARLKSVGLLTIDEKTGSWIDAHPLFSSTDGIPSDLIRRFHQSVLQLAQKKLEDANPEKRTVKSVVFSISASRLTRAQKILDESISKIAALADESAQERDEVMCFSAQLFSLMAQDKEPK